MQQDSATLIYDLNTMKGTVESYIKKNSAAIQNSTVLSLKNRTEFYKSQKKKTENCFINEQTHGNMECICFSK